MGATKKRRQTKHRGNAAGMVEARGRTTPGRAAGGPALDAEGRRAPQPASWKKAGLKALMPVVILLPILLLTQKDQPLSQVITLLAFAYLMYIPLAYWSDRWVYNRYRKQQQGR